MFGVKKNVTLIETKRDNTGLHAVRLFAPAKLALERTILTAEAAARLAADNEPLVESAENLEIATRKFLKLVKMKEYKTSTRDQVLVEAGS